MNFGTGQGRIVFATVRNLEDNRFTMGIGGKGVDHPFSDDGRDRRGKILGTSKAFLVSHCSAGSRPHVVGLMSAGGFGRAMGLLATGSPCRNCRVPDVRAKAVGTTSNAASLRCHLVGPTGFSSGGGCPAVVCICKNPRTRYIAKN